MKVESQTTQSRLEPVHRFHPLRTEGGLSLSRTRISKSVARHSQDLVSIGHRNGHHPAALAQASNAMT